MTLQCYYVPDSKARLLSPQRLFQEDQGLTGEFRVQQHHSLLEFDGLPSLHISHDEWSHLPIGLGKNASSLSSPIQAHLAVLNKDNQNLTAGQKLLLEWHLRLGHWAFQKIQFLLRHAPFVGDRFKASTRCDCPRSEVCKFMKGHCCPTHDNKQRTNSVTDSTLKADALHPGRDISVDHFESHLPGCTITLFWKTISPLYVGGCIFVDHMSGYLHVEHQLGFSSSEMICAKQNFEKLALDNGVIVESYHANNGVFKVNAFVSHIWEHNQKLSYCGVNAHHKNAVAEWAIRTVSQSACALLLHAALNWKLGIGSSLWPLAVTYTAYLFNHLPNSKGIELADLFTGQQVPPRQLLNCNTWVCPVYVLDPTLANSKKLPCW